MKNAVGCWRRVCSVFMAFVFVFAQFQTISYAESLPVADQAFVLQAIDMNAGIAPPGSIESIFPDPAFAQVVADSLKMNVTDVVAQTDLNKIKILNANRKGIYTIEGIQYLRSITDINLIGNNISDISQLEYANLSHLNYLSLGGNQISDISPLESAGLSALERLDLSVNLISDISPLSNMNLSNLELLSLHDNQIVDIHPLETARLSRLNRLWLYSNQISDISPLENAGLDHVIILYLHSNQISDISALASLNRLQRLNLQDNQVNSIAPLSGLRNLIQLYLGHNQISDISPLRGADFSKLSSLYLNSNQISDISPLKNAELNMLSTLWIGQNQIADISPLASLPSLSYIQADQQKIVLPSAYRAEPLVVQNIVTNIDGNIIEPGSINNSGVYIEPNITWSGLQNTTTEVTYTFGVSLLGGYYTGTVTQPISHTAPQPEHTITITTQYADGALPDRTESFPVADGDVFRHTLDVLDGYELVNYMQLRSQPLVNWNTNELYIETVDRDYEFVFEFDKKPITEHTVSLTTRYLDGALPDNTETFTVDVGDSFRHTLDVLEGYELMNYMQRSQPVINWNTNEVYIAEVDQDVDLLFEFDKATFVVKVTVKYDDGALEDQVSTYDVLYGEPLTVSFTVEPGYAAYSTQADPGMGINIRNGTITIPTVKRNLEATIYCQ